MYCINKHLNGTYTAMCGIQDGTEYYSAVTLDDAVTWLKDAAKNCNYQKIKRKDINYYEEETYQTSRHVRKPIPPQVKPL